VDLVIRIFLSLTWLLGYDGKKRVKVRTQAALPSFQVDGDQVLPDIQKPEASITQSHTPFSSGSQSHGRLDALLSRLTLGLFQLFMGVGISHGMARKAPW
jgi:hypothetical protein